MLLLVAFGVGLLVSVPFGDKPSTGTPAVVVWLDRKLPDGRSARIDGMWGFGLHVVHGRCFCYLHARTMVGALS